MDNNSFNNILHHFPENSIEEVHEILALKKRYPYSQVLHVLAARLSKDHHLNHQNQELELAAIYSTDRSVLKELMLVTADDEIKQVTYIETTTVSERQEVQSISFQQQATVDASSYDTIAEEVMRDLERLNELKHNFELLFIDGSSQTLELNPPTIEEAEEKPFHKKASKKEEVAPKEKSGLTKKERIIALAKEADALAQTQTGSKNLSNTKKKNSIDSGEGLIDEIVSTKQALNPDSEKQKEQIEIIDQFIKAQPTITNKDRVPIAPAADLTAIKSGEFGDNVVSETLVDILIQQGKKDKAIEVLKKLIWKFPQKKAYFAAQIEELKK